MPSPAQQSWMNGVPPVPPPSPFTPLGRVPRSFRKHAGRTTLYTLLLVLGALQLFPLIWVGSYSLLKSGDLFGSELLKLPLHPQWDNYVRAFRDGKVLRYALNSLVVVSSSTLVSTFLSFCMAYAITRMKWRLKAVAMAAVTMGMVIPIHTTLLPNFIWFSYFKLIDTHLGVIIPYVAFTLSFNTLVYMGQLKTLPPSMEEAALIDGASWPRILFSVVGPMVMPATMTVGVMTFLNNWNEFIMANTYLATDDLRTLPFSIIRFQGQYRSDYAVQFACMVLVALPALLLYFVFSRRIMEGATAGAIKG
ncbi:MAG TPA: carbohydrate ABC transporter permease [Anaeromyxobacter sp.]|nr:carbohydrate ABC transporter permease [Anaeromyxobacter sp.]